MVEVLYISFNFETPCMYAHQLGNTLYVHKNTKSNFNSLAFYNFYLYFQASSDNKKCNETFITAI